MRSLQKLVPAMCHVMSLAQQVRQGKADVEGRVSEMDHFMIEQNKLPLVDENVLRAVIAMNDGQPGFKCLCNQIVEEGPGLGNLRGGISVVRFNAQALEKRPVLKNVGNRWPVLQRRAMNGAKQIGELLHVFKVYVAFKQRPFPVIMRLRNGGHPNQMMRSIFEKQRGDCVGGSQL